MLLVTEITIIVIIIFNSIHIVPIVKIKSNIINNSETNRYYEDSKCEEMSSAADSSTKSGVRLIANRTLEHIIYSEKSIFMCVKTLKQAN